MNPILTLAAMMLLMNPLGIHAAAAGGNSFSGGKPAAGGADISGGLIAGTMDSGG